MDVISEGDEKFRRNCSALPFTCHLASTLQIGAWHHFCTPETFLSQAEQVKARFVPKLIPICAASCRCFRGMTMQTIAQLNSRLLPCHFT
jgi:hypothetical protein